MSDAINISPSLIPWDDDWGIYSPVKPQSTLSWVHTATSRSVEARLTMEQFNRALRAAQIFDNRAIDSAGAAVVLPYGVELLSRFRAKVHNAYRTAGLVEYEYPNLIPASYVQPTRSVTDVADRLLLVGRESELIEGEPPLVLAPTGEMVIYPHWARAITKRGDLPVRMYRRARYFRPVSRGRHSGRGLMYGPEHDDIFEFHCAYASRKEQQQDISRLRVMVDKLIQEFHVPVFWSSRPPWTNRSEIANYAMAADSPLPLGVTGQLACIYDQGTKFSSTYRIGFRERGAFYTTEQLTGYVSRRLLLAHLMLGMHDDGRLFIHPNLSPTQILLIVRDSNHNSTATIDNLLGLLSNKGIATRTVRCTSSAEVRRAYREWNPKGVPIIMQAFEPTSTQQPWKVVIERCDTGEETTVYLADPVDLFAELVALLEDLRQSFAWQIWEYSRRRVVPTESLGLLEEVLTKRMVALSPLMISEEAVREIDALRRGEVLGFCHREEPQSCILTGKLVNSVALISPRL